MIVLTEKLPYRLIHDVWFDVEPAYIVEKWLASEGTWNAIYASRSEEQAKGAYDYYVNLDRV